MNIHPLVVHFPIALLSFYTLLEFLTLFPFAKSRKLKTTKILLLFGGVVGGLFALQTGEFAEELFKNEAIEQILERHEFFAELSLKPYMILLALYLFQEMFQQERQKKYRQQWRGYLGNISQWISAMENMKFFVVLAIIGFVLLSITGSLGGSMVYGPQADPLTKIIFDLLQ